MEPTRLLLTMAAYLGIAGATHFRGGLVTWRTVGPVNRTAPVSIEITQRYAWRRDFNEDTKCDETTIGTNQLTGDDGDFMCVVGCQGNAYLDRYLDTVRVYCTDFIAVEPQWMVGERTSIVSIPYVPVFEASFRGNEWIASLVVMGPEGYWEVRAKMNFDTILTRRNGNASPKTRMSPVINLLAGCDQTITIPVEDEDGDDIRCRWSIGSLGECADVCNGFPGAIIDARECTISYSAANSSKGLYAVAIQIEDFYSPLDTQPFSSTPLQFLVNVTEPESTNSSCYGRPTFVRPTRRNGACVGIPLGSTYQDVIVAQSGGSGVSIGDIGTQSPVGMRKSSLGAGPGSNQWHVNITWTPTGSQSGSHIFCFVATDSMGTDSAQRCITFAAGAHPPSVRPGSLTPSGFISPDQSSWQLEYDRAFVRPLSSAFIRFHDVSGRELFRIDAATNPSVRYPNSTAPTLLSFQTRYAFNEKASYYITIDNGLAIGLEACGPESDRIDNPQWWMVAVLDLTPPVLTFLQKPLYSSGNIRITWMYDEEVQSICAVQSPSSLSTVPCNDSLSLSGLEEGSYTLFVQATDDAGNSAQYSTSWYVDLTPPNVLISIHPPPVTNTTSASFSVRCLDEAVCQLYCAVHDQGTAPAFQNCSGAYAVSSLRDGRHVFTVYATDNVGNTGTPASFQWVTDTIPPTITPVRNVSISCGSSFQPSATGIPNCADNIDQSPTLAYVDQATDDCRTLRIWTARDAAGNTAQFVQVISFIDVVPPSVGGTPELYVPCEEADMLTSSDYVVRALNVSSVCGRKLSVAFADTTPIEQCGIIVTREWIITDDCGGLTHFTQTLHVLLPSNPDAPDNGQPNVYIRQSLQWPEYPGSLGYNIYIWRFGSAQPAAPTSFLQSWRRSYTPAEAYPPNTKILWKLGYLVTLNGTTREIPGPVWGFQTESFADLSVVSVAVPQTAFSGSAFTVTWRIDNVGNVSTSDSTGYFYDQVKLGRSANVDDASVGATVGQTRYVEPNDGYVSSCNIHLGASDVGKFYVFVMADVYSYIREAENSRDNNRLLAPQPVQVQLTPPPNLKVTSVVIIGSVFSGQSVNLRYVVENAGIGITAATGWRDRVFLSKDEEGNSNDRRLADQYHSGALASGNKYSTSLSVDVPNALYGVYYIIVATDIDNSVFENTDEGDNYFALNVTIVLSPFPDLVVTSVSAPAVAKTGELVTVSAVVKNAGVGSPFEYSWSDALSMASADDGVIHYGAERRFGGGRQFAPDSVYRVDFAYTIPPIWPTGNYSVVVLTDSNREVFEFQSEDNNNATTIIGIVQMLPDLTVDESSVETVVNYTGNYVTYNATIANRGTGTVQVPFWEDRLVVTSASGSSVVDVRTSLAGEFQNKSYHILQRTVYIPVAIFGSTGVFFSLDARNQIVETNAVNNYVQLSTVVLGKRETDLAITGLTAPEAVRAGSNILVRWTVANRGNLACGSWLSWYDVVSVSFAALYTDDLHQELISFANFLQPGATYSRLANVTIPSGYAGVYKLRVTVGRYATSGEGAEVNMTNNFRERTLVVSTPPSPDFKLQSCQSELTTVQNLRLLAVSCSIANTGNGMEVPVNWTDQISLISGTGSTLLTSYVSSTRKLLPREVYTVSTTFILTQSVEGYVQIEVQIDISNSLSKPGINRILRFPTAIFIPSGPSPILSVSIQPLQKIEHISGSLFTVNCTITNAGQAGLPLSTWTDSMFLLRYQGASKLQVISQGFLIGSKIQNLQLDIDRSYDVSFQGKLPYFVDGYVFVYVVTDANSRLPVTDNGKAAYLNSSIHIQQGPLPDLVAMFDKNETFTVQSGDIVEILFSVTNIGNSSAAGIWYDTVYLSEDKFVDPFDVPLKTLSRLRQLDSGDTYIQKAYVNVPYDLPGSSYYFLVVANVRKECVESVYDNNANSIRVDVQVLPAVDLVVLNVTSSKLNVTYLEELSFGWIVENNGSIATTGRKCDSVYLSMDDKWDITDIAVVDSNCGYFSFQPKGSLLGSMDYSALTTVPTITVGEYKTIVRTRSNVKDFNLTNNIGVSEETLVVNSLTISLGENKTFTMHTNHYMTFQLTGIQVGIGIAVSLTTNYEFAYHRLYIKHNKPPMTNDYDIASKQLDTEQQRISVPYARTGSYYLLIESSSAFSDVVYQVSVLVKEAKFEVTGVFPSTVLVDSSVTLKISGTLFPQKIRAFLSNDTHEVEASNVYRFMSEEAYATFDTTSFTGSYSLSLRAADAGATAELRNAVTVSGLLVPGKLQTSIQTPGALRQGRTAIIQVKIDNAGYSDVPSPVLLLQTGGNSRVVSTEADLGTASTAGLIFMPTERNRPPSVITPKSSTSFSFEVFPNSDGFVGKERLFVENIDDSQLAQLLVNFKSYYKPHNVPSDTWDVVWNQVNHCFGDSPSTLLSTVSGHFSQHYTSFYNGVPDVLSHVVEVADGAVPTTLMSGAIDLENEAFNTLIPFGIARNYYQQISVRRTTGPFGRGWTAPILETRAEIVDDVVYLADQRQQFIFYRTGNVFSNARLTGDTITYDTNHIVYTTENSVYIFDRMSTLLTQIKNTRGRQSVSITYNGNGMASELTHNGGGSIRLAYDSQRLVSNAQLNRNNILVNQVYYTYSSAGLLLSVSGQTTTTYEYNDVGDLTAIRENDGQSTLFTYDDKQLLSSVSEYADGQNLIQTLATKRYCDGRVDVTLLPLNISSSFLYGFGGQNLQEDPGVGLPNIYNRDSRGNNVEVVVGDDVKFSQKFDIRTKTVTSLNSNGEQLTMTVRDDGQIASIGDEQSPYYEGGFQNNTLTNVTYRDGTYSTVEYNELGQTSAITNRDGSKQSYQYGTNNRLSQVQTADGTTIYSYNSVGLISDIVSTDGMRTRVSYNARKQPTSVEYPDGVRLDYSYNRCGMRSSVVSNDGYNSTYVYDERCRLSQIFDGSGSLMASFEYNSESKLHIKRLGNGIYTEYIYEHNSHRIKSIKNFFPNDTLLSWYSYEYDAWGRRVLMATREGNWTYKYDAMGQLTEWTSPMSASNERIEYDSNGNRKTKETPNSKTNYYTNSMHQYTDVGKSQNFTYDKNGNLIQKSIQKGNEIVVEQYNYNADGRLSQTVVGKLSCEYKYNAFGTLSSKVCSDGTRVTYVSDPFGMFGANILAQNTNNSNEFVYHSMEHGLVGTAQSGDRAHSQFFLFDADGSAVHTVDQSARITHEYVYDPFGVQLSQSRSGDSNTFRFMAQYGVQTSSENSNIIFMRARLYDAEHGRFVSPDPAGVQGSPTNPYCYGKNNPLTYKDSTGRNPLAIIGFGTVVGGVAGAVGYLTSPNAKNFKWDDLSTYGDLARATTGGMLAGAITTTVGVAVGSAGLGWFGASLFKVTSGMIAEFFNKLIKGDFKDGFSEDDLYDIVLAGLLGFSRKKATVPGMKDIIKDAAKGLFFSKLKDCLTNLKWCLSQVLEWVRSMDPNEMSVKPIGYGDGRYIASEQLLEYKIEFENDPNATSPAQLVTIKCRLDPSLDLASFRVGSFVFGNVTYDAGFNSFYHSNIIDATEQTRVFVFVEGRLDTVNAEASWIFQSLDATGIVPTDPLLGFLPPNNGTTGQGYVTFRIRPKKDAVTLTKIDQLASIVFDENPPIETPQIFTTLDKTPPRVKMNVSVVTGGVLIQFEKIDEGSGVKTIDLFSVEDDRATLLKGGIDQPAIVVNLEPNRQYTLAAMATDNVNNVDKEIDLTNAVSILVPAECPSNCSGRGVCSPTGICLCDVGFGGADCGINATSQCAEPPVIGLSYSNTTQNTSIVIFLSASSPRSNSNGSLSVHVTCSPPETGLSKGTTVDDGVELSESDFGDIVLTPPEYFSGLLTCALYAQLVDDCGQTNRTAQLSLYVMPTSQYTSQQFTTFGMLMTTVVSSAQTTGVHNDISTLYPETTERLRVTLPSNMLASTAVAGGLGTSGASATADSFLVRTSQGVAVPAVTTGDMVTTSAGAISTAVSIGSQAEHTASVAAPTGPDVVQVSSDVSDQTTVEQMPSVVTSLNKTEETVVNQTSATNHTLEYDSAVTLSVWTNSTSESRAVDLLTHAGATAAMATSTETFGGSQPASVTPVGSLSSASDVRESPVVSSISTEWQITKPVTIPSVNAENTTIRTSVSGQPVETGSSRADVGTDGKPSTTDQVTSPSSRMPPTTATAAVFVGSQQTQRTSVDTLTSSSVIRESTAVSTTEWHDSKLSTSVTDGHANTERQTSTNSQPLTAVSSARVSTDSVSVSSSRTQMATTFRASGADGSKPATFGDRAPSTAVVRESRTSSVVDGQSTGRQTTKSLSYATSSEDNAATQTSRPDPAITTEKVPLTTSGGFTSSSVEDTTHAWSSWSEWSSCSRSCDSGIQHRERLCLPSPGDCTGQGVDNKICSVGSCPGMEDEATEGTLITMSADHTTIVLAKLSLFLQWISRSINSYCSQRIPRCCTAVFGTFTAGWMQQIADFTSVDLLSLGSGFPQQTTQLGSYAFKVIARVDRHAVRPQCIAVTGRKRRQTDIAFLNATLITEAILQNRRDIENNLTVKLQEVISVNSAVSVSYPATTTSSPAPPTDHTVPIAIGIAVGVGCLIILVVCCLMLRRKRKKYSSRLTVRGDWHDDSASRDVWPTDNDVLILPEKYAPVAPQHSAAIAVGSRPDISRHRPYGGQRQLSTDSSPVGFSGRSIVTRTRPKLVHNSHFSESPVAVVCTCGQNHRPCGTPYAVYWNRAFVGSSHAIDCQRL